MKMSGIKFNFATNTITMTKEFAVEASSYGTEEHAVMKQIQKDYPSMVIVTRQSKKSGHKNRYKGLTYKFMRSFILNLDKDNLISYEKTIAYYSGLTEDKTSVFINVREWFLDNYPNYAEMVVDGAPKANKTQKVTTLKAITSLKEEREDEVNELAAVNF